MLSDSVIRESVPCRPLKRTVRFASVRISFDIIESPVSLIPRGAVERVDQVFTSETEQNNSPSTLTDNGQTVQTAEDSKPTEETSIPIGVSTATSKQSVLPILLASLWLFGTAVMLLYALGSYLKLRRKTDISCASVLNASVGPFLVYVA